MTLYLLQYNNYYNRILKREDSITDYLRAAQVYSTIENTDFNENDGVITQKVVNIDLAQYSSDYAIAYNPLNNTILSRWFIMDSKRTRMGQYQITLQRDLFADFYDTLKRAPMFLEKGYVNANSPLIFNSENMTFNEIKQSETLLKDNTNIPWIVGYISLPKKYDDVDTSVDTVVPFRKSPVSASETATSIEDLTFYRYLNAPRTLITEESYSLFTFIDYISTGDFIEFNEDGVIASYSPAYYGTSGYKVDSYDDFTAIRAKINSGLNLGRVKSALGNTISGRLPQEDYDAMKALDRKIVYISGEDKYYQAIFSETTDSNLPNILTGNFKMTMVPKNGALQYELNAVVSNQINSPTTIITGSPYQEASDPSSASLGYAYKGKRATLVLQEWTIGDNETITIKNTRRQLEDAPYCMFCIPYGNYHIIDTDPTDPKNFVANAEMGLSIGTGLLALGSTWCYDVQLLPYCPIEYLRNAPLSSNPSEGLIIDLAALKKDIDYSLPTNLTATKQVVFWSRVSKGSFNIAYNKSTPTNAIDFKIDALTKKHRLCSPNYAAQFEFNYCKNGGIQYFNVDYTYKPVSPYIHINPNFGRLYGSDFDDPRGLICSGDFSITSVSNQWLQYQLNNKNYQLAFDRQVENMETNRRLERIGQGVGIGLGTLQGAATGVMMGGMMTANPVGAIAGGIAGGVSSLAGGIADYAISEAAFNEALDYKQDLFGMQLDNIKALPNTLNKVSAFNNNNKIFPVLEEYGSTDVEKQALRNKLTYNGMTIGIITTLEENVVSGMRWYYKGQPIRLDDINNDFHITNALANEMNKGVYIE